MISSVARASYKANLTYSYTSSYLSRVLVTRSCCQTSLRRALYRAEISSAQHAYSTTTDDALPRGHGSDLPLMQSSEVDKTVGRSKRNSSVDELKQSDEAADRNVAPKPVVSEEEKTMTSDEGKPRRKSKSSKQQTPMIKDGEGFRSIRLKTKEKRRLKKGEQKRVSKARTIAAVKIEISERMQEIAQSRKTILKKREEIAQMYQEIFEQLPGDEKIDSGEFGRGIRLARKQKKLEKKIKKQQMEQQMEQQEKLVDDFEERALAISGQANRELRGERRNIRKIRRAARKSLLDAKYWERRRQMELDKAAETLRRAQEAQDLKTQEIASAVQAALLKSQEVSRVKNKHELRNQVAPRFVESGQPENQEASNPTENDQPENREVCDAEKDNLPEDQEISGTAEDYQPKILRVLSQTPPKRSSPSIPPEQTGLGKISDLVGALKKSDIPTELKTKMMKELRETLKDSINLPVSSSETDSSKSPVPKSKSHAAQDAPTDIATSMKGSSIKDAIRVSRSNRPVKDPLRKPGMLPYEVQTVAAHDLKLSPLQKEQPPVPGLAYGLERVLFNPGVYQLQDQRSRVFNFDPYLQKIMPASEFDFNALKQYVTSSRDTALLSAAAEANKKYTGSTSSMTAALAHFHFLLSNWRPVATGKLSKGFPAKLDTFTAITRAPTSIFVRYKDGVYAIDADKEYDSANILMMLGKSMEKLLTLHTDEFEKYRRSKSDQLSDAARNDPESYHYSTMGDILMRSQLDAHDPRLPGTGMFDLKTRAVASIRFDVANYEEGTGYELRSRHGEFESYEREYYDMIRAAFLKYSLQVRMGRMDGIFVAFHNIQRLFGFQYISISEMDYSLHGSEDTTIGDSEFKLSVELLNKILNRATERFPKKSLRLFIETRPSKSDVPYTYIFARPIDEDAINRIQGKGQKRVAKFEREVLAMQGEEEDPDIEKKATWDETQARIEESVDHDEIVSLKSITGTEDSAMTVEEKDVSESETIVQNEDEDELVEEANVGETIEEEIAEDIGEEEDLEDNIKNGPMNGQHESLGMILTVRNKVNGEYVTRPENLVASDTWTVEYALADIDPERVPALRKAMKLRRHLALNNDQEKPDYLTQFLAPFKKLSKEGHIRRQAEDALYSDSPIKVLAVDDFSKPKSNAGGKTEKE